LISTQSRHGALLGVQNGGKRKLNPTTNNGATTMRKRFYLKADFNEEWTEVSLEKYCSAERSAGFRPPLPSDDPRYMTTPATGGFGGAGIQGRIDYSSDN
jgi:hypothetical protein